jgi:hypothetical protein
MKRLAVLATAIFLVLSPSQAKTSDVVQVTPYQKRSGLKNPTLTKNVLARVASRPQRKFLATNVLHLDIDDDDGPAGPDELDLHNLYRRPKVVEQPADDVDVSDYVRVRLAVARAKAMSVYRAQQV